MKTEILYIVLWLATIEIVGLAALPLTQWLFRALPDRGYAFAKPLGLLLISYSLWLLGSVQILHNTRLTIFLLLIALATVSWGKFRSLEAARTPRHVVWATEILFLAAFAYLIVLKMYDPAINHTEKPMDFGFLNAILRSDTFPPHDPWLSGFGISYYYFGYLMMAVLTKLSSVPSAISFNLSVCLLFALAMTGAFSIVYNLIKSHAPTIAPAPAPDLVGAQRAAPTTASNRTAIIYGILGAILVGFTGNLEGLLELLHDRGIGSTTFWQWIDVKDLAQQPLSAGWPQAGSWWWWRASRVIKDVTFGNVTEVIDEFPFFSFMLGDMHPHVLGLPFVLLAIALALNLLLSADETFAPILHLVPYISRLTPHATRNTPHALRLPILARYVLLALCLGALGFLNTWDFPIYLFIIGTVYALRRCRPPRFKKTSEVWMDIGVWGAGLLILGVALYLPFYIGFRSQAGGVLPNLFTPTRLHQFLIYAGIQLFAVISLLIILTVQAKGALKKLVSVLPLTILMPIGISAGAVLLILTTRRELVDTILSHPQARELLGDGDIGSVIVLTARTRLAAPWTYLFLAILLAWTIALLWQLVNAPRPTQYVLILITTALLLFFSTEFVYLRDNFGTRMNTIFKFYYQAWTLMGISAAYAAYKLSLAPDLRGFSLSGSPYRVQASLKPRRSKRVAWQVAFTALIAAGLIYPLASTYSKAGGFQGQPTLDGSAFIRDYRPADYAAILWLRANSRDTDVILEANGDSYHVWDNYVSVHSGLSTLLGWGGHESQWRGNYREAGRRESVISKIYTSSNISEVRALLDEYNVTFVYVGPTEREKFGNLAGKNLGRFLEVVFQQGDVVVYRNEK